MLSAVKAARKFVEAAPWKDFIVSRFGPVGSAETDDEIIAAARDSVDSIWHPTSTARMSPKHARWGVVDPQLLVKGAHGLRIVDASVFVSVKHVFVATGVDTKTINSPPSQLRTLLHQHIFWLNGHLISSRLHGVYNNHRLDACLVSVSYRTITCIHRDVFKCSNSTAVCKLCEYGMSIFLLLGTRQTERQKDCYIV